MNNAGLTSISYDLIRQPKRYWLNLYVAMSLAIIVLIVWSAYAYIDVMVFGQGKVIPASEVKMVQHYEGGIIADILVKAGQRVKKGDILLKVDNITINSELNEIQSRLQGINGSLYRLEAEINQKDLVFPDNFSENYPNIAAREIQLYEQRKKSLLDSLNSFESQIKKNKSEQHETRKQLNLANEDISLMDEEFKLSEELYAQDAVSKVELLQLKRRLHQLKSNKQKIRAALFSKQNEANRLRQDLDIKQAKFKNEALQLRNKLEIEKNTLLDKVLAARDKSVRSEVKSPVSGIINQILVNTLGGVVKPGMNLIEIVPQDGKLLIEAKIKPEDIAFIHLGQKTKARLTAYDFALYGSLLGQVVYISSDTIEEKNGQQFYIIRVKTENSLQRYNKSFPIFPGMIAKVDIITGKRNILSYITKPIVKTKERALREK